jgi:hypothetical protein
MTRASSDPTFFDSLASEAVVAVVGGTPRNEASALRAGDLLTHTQMCGNDAVHVRRT